MVGIVIATHGNIGAALLETAVDMVGFSDPGVKAISLHANVDRASGWQTIGDAVDDVDTGNGVLILVDMFGGTPSTLALSLLAEKQVEVLTGVNLAMVLRAILRRKKQSLEQLAPDVLAYGQRNVTSSVQWLTANSSDSE